jgi:hypothetical protein
VNNTFAPHKPESLSTTILAGQKTTGSSLSTTVTVKEQTELFPCASVAVVFTIVVPTVKNEPEAGIDATVKEQLSLPVTVKETLAPHTPGSVFTVIFEGQFNTGASESETVTVKEQSELFPEGSVAVE